MILSYFRARLTNKIHSLIVSEFSKQESLGVISRACLAKRVGKKPEQITRWIGSSGNWTIETLSDLLLGMGLEPSISLKKISDNSPCSTINEWKSYEKIVYINVNDEKENKALLINLKIPNPLKTLSINLKAEYDYTKNSENYYSIDKDKNQVLETNHD